MTLDDEVRARAAARLQRMQVQQPTERALGALVRRVDDIQRAPGEFSMLRDQVADFAHGTDAHSGKIGEQQIEIVIPLVEPLPAATANATLDDDYVYRQPYERVGRRINAWYVRLESNLAANATFQLRRNGTAITGATFAILAGARDAAIDAFEEVALVSGDSLEVWQTVGNAESIGGKAHVYGNQDVLSAAP